MPLPLIPLIGIALAGTTAIHGVKKGFEASRDMNEAKTVASTSQEIAREAEDFLKMAKENTENAVTELGREKIRLLTTSIKDFVDNYERIKDIDFKKSAGTEELRSFNPSSDEFRMLKVATFEAGEVAVNGLAAIGSGALLAYGTYSVVMGGLGGVLVTATTGTALSTLTGIAATNATLAWLGGGALAAGGLGMAGGMAVLGGLVAGPALAIGGSIFAQQAKTALNDAHSNYDKARAYKSQARNIGIALKSIYIRANQLTELLNQLDELFVEKVTKMVDVIRTSGTKWNNYTDAQKKDIYMCVQIAGVIKNVLDGRLLTENGELDAQSMRVLEDGKKYLSLLN